MSTNTLVERPSVAQVTEAVNGPVKGGVIGRAVRRVRRGVAAVATTVAITVAGASASMASTPSVETEIQEGFSSIQTLFLVVIVPAFFAFIVAILGVLLASKWVGKAAKKS